MTTLRLQFSIYMLLCGFLCGFFIAFLFMGGNNDPLPGEIIPSTSKRALRNIAILEKRYQNRITVLQNQNNELQQKLTTTQSRLELSKLTVKKKEANVTKLAQTSKRKKLTWPSENYSIALFDTPECECDSLKKETINYINENHRKDSLYETQLATMDSVVFVKDSIILANEGLYNSLDSVYHQAIAVQAALQTENRLLKKKEKRRKVRNRLLTAGLLILSGTFIHFIHH